ncbi:hypothetical protein A9Q84_17655 [Halobacteriovorax marinus]|uniref:Uncharacterized protein n=1 Tax=Halobacteriovorax marinus TaxID=97084 RepID=A0A1Y5F362_9BACT|nr:hypothetical protein A9Q84_17655 [Halobacteriovorax marinus]
MFRLNNKGFSQLNLLAGVFCLGIVVVIVMRTIKKQTETLNNITAEAEIVNYINKVRGYLSSPTNCYATFSGKTIDGTNVNSIVTVKDGLESNRYEVFSISKKAFGTQEIKVIKYELADSNAKDEIVSDYGLMYLNIHLDKNLDSITASKAIRKIKVYVKLVNQKISECAYGGLPEGSNISQDRGNYTFLNSKAIGLGTQNLSATLNVNNYIQLEGSLEECTENTLGSLRFNEELSQFEECATIGSWKKVHK